MIIKQIERNNDLALLPALRKYNNGLNAGYIYNLARLIVLYKKRKALAYMAIVNGQPVGYICYSFDDSIKSICVDDLYVIRSQRGRGYGSKLLKFVCEDKRLVMTKTHYLNRSFWFWNGFRCVLEIGVTIYMTLDGKQIKNKVQPEINLSQHNIVYARTSYLSTLNNLERIKKK